MSQSDSLRSFRESDRRLHSIWLVCLTGRGCVRRTRSGHCAQVVILRPQDWSAWIYLAKTAVDDLLLDEIKASKWLDAGASALGARVHKLPTGPDQVPSDGEFRYVILGPGANRSLANPRLWRCGSATKLRVHRTRALRRTPS
jgi:hypothetical protein